MKRYKVLSTVGASLLVLMGITARYVRLYSNGNNANDQNHYLEVEVFGVPVVAEP